VLIVDEPLWYGAVEGRIPRRCRPGGGRRPYGGHVGSAVAGGVIPHMGPRLRGRDAHTAIEARSVLGKTLLLAWTEARR
jgi:hypothetical protein